MNEVRGVLELIQCPACKELIKSDLTCSGCGRKYSSREDMLILIDRETSELEWKWDRRILSKKYRNETLSGYEKLISEEIREARNLWWRAASPFLEKVKGRTVDVATGMGQLLNRITDGRPAEIIATDIDPNILLSTKREMDERNVKGVSYVATDARHLSFRDSIADYVTSFSGINNITDTKAVLKEIFRIMKPGGTFLMMEAFVDDNTNSADLADDYGLKDAYIMDRLLTILKDTGFSIKTRRKASSVIWKENAMDVFPLDGDKVYHYIIEIQKP